MLDDVWLEVVDKSQVQRAEGKELIFRLCVVEVVGIAPHILKVKYIGEAYKPDG